MLCGVRDIFFTSLGKRESQPSFFLFPHILRLAFTDDIFMLSCRWCLWEVRFGEKRALLSVGKQMRAALMPG